MHFPTTAIATLAGLASFAAAAPTIPSAPVLETRACAAYPWFIVPYPDSPKCGGTPAVFQPTGGPLNPNSGPTGCRPLWDPRGKPQSFASVSINRDACPEQKWEIRLYVDGGCGTKPTIVRTSTCIPAPGLNAAGRWESFEAVPLK